MSKYAFCPLPPLGKNHERQQEAKQHSLPNSDRRHNWRSRIVTSDCCKESGGSPALLEALHYIPFSATDGILLILERFGIQYLPV